MTKIDFKKSVDSYTAKHKKFDVIEVPPMQYLMIDGHGDPNTSNEFADAVSTLFPIAYKLKFMSKEKLKKDYVVPPLEGLWWAKDMDKFTKDRDKSAWDWTMMLMVPEWITAEMYAGAKEQVMDKNLPLLSKVRFEKITEGLCVQTLHVGSFDNEGQVLDYIHHEFIPQNGLKMRGKHHEIYLSDFRKVPAAKLRTILRQPVERV